MNTQKLNEYFQNMREVFSSSVLYSVHYFDTELNFHNLGFKDTTWHQDLCPSFSMGEDAERMVRVWLPNSNKHNIENEEFNTCGLDLYDENNCNGLNLFETTDINEIYSLIKSNHEFFTNHINKKG